VILPNFLVAGAGKSGTTTLWSVLRRHPDVFMPRVKEISFFTGAIAPRSTYARGLDWYAGLFEGGAGRAAVGEASVAYLFDPESPRLIQKHLGTPRLIFILRDPAERAYSHYWQERKRGGRLPPFDDLVRTGAPPFDRLVRSGLYATHLRRYLDHFPRESLLVRRYEELRDTPDTLYGAVCDFLGIDAVGLPRDTGRRENAAALPRSALLERRVLRSTRLLGLMRRLVPPRVQPWGRAALIRLKQLNRAPIAYPPMSCEARASLVERFQDEIDGTERLLGWDLSAWRARA
jgi:hypothetical protein